MELPAEVVELIASLRAQITALRPKSPIFVAE